MFTTLRPQRPQRPLRLGALAVLLLIGCTDTVTQSDPALTRETAGATFDWTMPDRFGADQDGDGLLDYPRTEEELQPSTWTVNFDACNISGDKYHWFVAGTPVAKVTTCTYAHDFPAEGVYDVSLHVISTPGSSVWAREMVPVQDWLVISFGDSYASGEGVPEVPQANDSLVQSLTALFGGLAAARQNLTDAQASLQNAFEAKGLAEQALAVARQRRADFLAACSDIDSWSDVVTCKNFLVARALSFELFSQAQAFFNQAVTNAQERVADLTLAFNQAQAAVTAAQSAVANAQAAIQAAQTGFQPPRWQAAFPNEDWNGSDCHRSARAAPARAALALERGDPRTSVTFVHLACTGAQVNVGRANLTKQIPWADALVGEREIDAVLMSIGGNDAGFSSLAVGCAVQEPCNEPNPSFDAAAGAGICPLLALAGFQQQCDDFFADNIPIPATETLRNGLAELPIRYAQLDATHLPKLRGLLEPATDGVRSNRVYITEYVDMTKGPTGEYCTNTLANPLAVMPGFSLGEMQWLDLSAGQGINGAVQAAAQEHGWNFVSGIYSAYAPHGYCADAHWVVRLHETFLIQGDEQGIAHPNRSGHEQNGAAIHQALIGDLYPFGPSGPPRAPDMPTMAALLAGPEL
jgi:hypothetical protein